QEIIELRRSYMRGLVPNKLLEHLTFRLTSANIAKTLMQNFVSIEKKRKAKKKHTSIEKVKNAGKGKTSVNNTNASSSEVCLEKSALVLDNSKKGIEEKSRTADSL
ncbi:4534_t:CDS:2, partial [Gigaspora rosea]